MTGRYFRFTSNGSNKNSNNHYVEIQIFDAAGTTNLALNRTIEYSYREDNSDPTYVTNGSYNNSSQYFDVGPGKAWIIIDLEIPQEISSIKIWRYYADSRVYNNCTVEVSEDKENWYLIYSSDITGTYQETSAGYTISKFLSYKTEGEVEFIIPNTEKITSIARSLISWDEVVPQGTSCEVLLKINDEEYLTCVNNSFLPGLSENDNLSNKILSLKVKLSTTNLQLTPSISNLQIQIQNPKDGNILILYFKEGKDTSIQNAAKDIEIIYDHEVLLPSLYGRKVVPFTKTFTPIGLIAKNNPNGTEHIEISNIKTITNLKAVIYTNLTETEHITLTNINTTAKLKTVNYINVAEFEHIELPAISVNAYLTPVIYINSQENEHITIKNIVGQGVLTRLEDL